MVFFAWTVVGPIPPYAREISSITFESDKHILMAALTIAISSSFLFACLYARMYSPWPVNGILNLVMTAEGGSAVVRYPLKNSFIGIEISPSLV